MTNQQTTYLIQRRSTDYSLLRSRKWIERQSLNVTINSPARWLIHGLNKLSTQSICLWFRSFHYNSDVRRHHKDESFVSIKGKNINKYENDEDFNKIKKHSCSTSLNKHPLQLVKIALLFWFELQREQIYESECPIQLKWDFFFHPLQTNQIFKTGVYLQLFNFSSSFIFVVAC